MSPGSVRFDGSYATTRTLHGLRTLSLAGNQIGPDGVRALAASPALAGLTELSLGGNPFGPEAAWALVNSPHLGRLKRLGLGGCGVLRDSPVAESLAARFLEVYFE